MGERNGGVFSIWRARCLSESGSSRASTEGTALYSASLMLPPPPLPSVCVNEKPAPSCCISPCGTQEQSVRWFPGRWQCCLNALDLEVPSRVDFYSWLLHIVLGLPQPQSCQLKGYHRKGAVCGATLKREVPIAPKGRLEPLGHHGITDPWGLHIPSLWAGEQRANFCLSDVDFILSWGNQNTRPK